MLSIEDQGNIQRLDLLGVRFTGTVMQQLEDIGCDGVVVFGVCFNADVVVMEVVPVEQNWAKQRNQPDGDLDLVIFFCLRLDSSQEGTSSPEHIHRVRVRGNNFQNGLQFLWNGSVVSNGFFEHIEFIT